MTISVPDRGVIFWPVGNGDSTTIRVDETVHLQIDLRHTKQSEDEEDPACAVIGELAELLPVKNGSPYLSTFVLTHPDQDHCQGFSIFKEQVFISEVWMSPRTFREFRAKEELCGDAEVFHKEAMRRIRATIDAKGDPGSGNRIRIIGYDDLLRDEEFRGLPEEFLSVPGESLTKIDGFDYGEEGNSDTSFSAFIHGPFKDDSYGDRNDCSLAFQITLVNNGGCGQFLLMGDLSYPTIRRILDVSNRETLQWNVLLAPHHCSKSVMFWQNDDEEQETLRGDIILDLNANRLQPGYVISSSLPVPANNKPGDNPPHAKAKEQYLGIVWDDFLCTQEHPNKSEPTPIIFEVGVEGLLQRDANAPAGSLSRTLNAAGVGGTTPATAVGFGYGD